MKTTEITTNEIFEAGQVLTLAKAKEMVGKTIAITSSEYRANTPRVRIFTVTEFISEWDWAAKREYTGDKYENYQQYWKSYMTAEQIANQKSRLMLLDDEGNGITSAELNLKRSFYIEPTFTGSDADREVYYIELNDEN